MSRHSLRLSLLPLLIALAPAFGARPGSSIWRPSEAAALRLDVDALDALLARAPLERTKDAERSTVVLPLPMPDGSFESFRIEESPVMEPLLAAKFPEIRTFRGEGLSDPTAITRLIRTSIGFEAQILTTNGVVRIQPVGEPWKYRSSYFRGASFQCGTEDDGRAPLAGPGRTPAITGTALRKYRLAVSCTSDFTALAGGTKQGAMNFIAGYVNRANGIYERDLTVHFDIVNGNDQLIFLTKPDGFNDANARDLLDQNQAKVDAVIGTANYDIGMVFAKSEPNSSNGVAQLQSVCSPTSKARNSQRIPEADPRWDSTPFHETAHQFGASHSFNTMRGACGNAYSPSTGWEPGGGTTIMSYSSVCDNVQQDSNGNGFSDLYFHGGNIAQMNAFITGATCTQTTPIPNTPPTVTIPNGPFTIPKGTPFTLTAAATPANPALTYLLGGA